MSVIDGTFRTRICRTIDPHAFSRPSPEIGTKEQSALSYVRIEPKNVFYLESFGTEGTTRSECGWIPYTGVNTLSKFRCALAFLTFIYM